MAFSWVISLEAAVSAFHVGPQAQEGPSDPSVHGGALAPSPGALAPPLGDNPPSGPRRLGPAGQGTLGWAQGTQLPRRM